ncbi:MAG: thioredoxin domain-containing protein [Clostridiales bacterium]|nr:thioredoxin domain-containing protein [Clostridiales bacterium]
MATNRLIKEKSPYLLQHAQNPVDWFPWGEEAFAKAKAEDKPIFLSIGYSTCHWCHVMSQESFEDDEVAKILNRDFVSVKLDREERPDVDSVYMSACQIMTGSGGWPLTIIMTPDKKPFYADTYLPKTSRYGKVGLIDLLEEVVKQWQSNRKRLTEAGDEITDYLGRISGNAREGEPSKKLIASAIEGYRRAFDPKWGGFGGAPKFPTPHNLIFLLRYSRLEGDSEARKMAEETLEHMYRGGIFDHIGGGFSRYSTDERWLVPHFEKMLYDNALLTYAYLEAFSLTGRRLYREAVEKTLDYVLRELTDPGGGFYCGQDADSEGVEGKYYVFKPGEVKEVLGKTEGEVFCRRFGISEDGNFEGKSIPNLIGNSFFEDESDEIRVLCKKLYEYRLRRTSLHKDDKILTSWNALMISAFARAALFLDNDSYLQAAKNAEAFISEKLTDDSGRLLIRWREGEAANLGQLDDYSFYALSLLELYDATFEASYLKKALSIVREMIRLFEDPENGGYYMYASDSEQLISRPKEVYDGAMPSGNSAAALVLNRLALLTGDGKLNEAADRQLRFISGSVGGYPTGHGFALLALTSSLYQSSELICASSGRDAPEELIEFLRKRSYPNLTTLVKTAENEPILSEILPFSAEYPIPENGSLYYLCRNRSCSSPTESIKELESQLKS